MSEMYSLHLQCGIRADITDSLENGVLGVDIPDGNLTLDEAEKVAGLLNRLLGVE